MVLNKFSCFEKGMIILVITWKNNFNVLILKNKKHYFNLFLNKKYFF